MKRAIFATVSFCLIEAILATTRRINVEKDNVTDIVKVSCNGRAKNLLEVGGTVDFGEVGAGFLFFTGLH